MRTAARCRLVADGEADRVRFPVSKLVRASLVERCPHRSPERLPEHCRHYAASEPGIVARSRNQVVSHRPPHASPTA